MGRSQCFNPRARVGRDLADRIAARGLDVSIHAPAWGATETQPPTPDRQVFQSTRPRGARRRLLSIILLGQTVSIHAPAWGATTWRKHTP